MGKLLKVSIDVTKIKKEHLYKGEKGTYANIDVWINDEKDKYGNDAGVKQTYKVGDKFDSHYIGNGKWFEKVQDAEVVEEPSKVEGTGDLPF